MTDDDQTRSGTPGAPAPHTTASDRATKKEWAELALLVLPMLAVATDLTVLFLALPTLSADLDPTASQGLWVVHVYGFLIAGFLVTMGRLGDRIGPRRLLLIGAAAFAAASVLAAYSATPGRSAHRSTRGKPHREDAPAPPSCPKTGAGTALRPGRPTSPSAGRRPGRGATHG
ncbi:hypothetical protein GCM10027590_64240 [Nocardiopsis nanhaiensis]